MWLTTIFDQKNGLFFNDTGSLVLNQPHPMEIFVGKQTISSPEIPLSGKRVNSMELKEENEKRPCI
jgi:hypothetical protein